MTKKKRRHESGTPEKEDGTIEELKAFIKEKTGEAVREIKQALDQRITSLEDSLNFAFESITVTSQKVTTLEKNLKEIYNDCQSLKCRVEHLEQEREEAEKLRRRPQLIFSGRDLHIPERDERLIVAVAAMINRQLELEVAPGQIISAKRLPKNRLLVRFAGDERGSLRDQVYRSKQKLRGQKIFINENLTPIRQDALNLLLHQRRQGRVSTVLTRGGEVLFAVSRDDRLTRVRSMEEVEHLLQLNPARDAADPPYSAVPGAAPALDQPRPRDPGQGTVTPTDAGRLLSGESMGAGSGPASVSGAARREDGSARSPHAGRVPHLDRPLPEQPGSGPRAKRRGGGEREEPRPEPMETSAGAEPCAGVPPPSALEPPLTSQTDAGGREDGRSTNVNAGESGLQEDAAGRGDPSAPAGAATSVHLHPTPAEVRQRSRGQVTGVSGEGKGTCEATRQGRVGRRTSSMPPGRRSGSGARADLGGTRHLAPVGGRNGVGGAEPRSRQTGSGAQPVGIRGSGEQSQSQESGPVKSRTCDIRNYMI